MSKKGDKALLIYKLNAKLREAGLPPLPPHVTSALRIYDLEVFDELWIAPVVGSLIAYGKKPGKAV